MSDPAIRVGRITKLFGTGGPALIEAGDDPARRAAVLQRHRADVALREVSLEVARGRVQVVMGLSGSGKSTLARHINRLIEPTSGTVEVEGQDMLALSPRALLAFRRERISMVFQRFALMPHRTVAENVAYGLKMAGVPDAARRERASQWIERVGLSGSGERYPSQLSGGMQQRVGLARALATDAPILLMDEAYSALDPLIRTDMQSLLLDLQKDLGRTIVFITHDLDEALRLGDRIAILKDGELVREGTGQDILLDPGSDYVSAFVADVDLSRWVEIGAIFRGEGLQQAPGDIAGPRIHHRVNLRVAARTLSAEGASSGAMVDDDGRVVRTVHLHEIVSAIARPMRLERTSQARDAASGASDRQL